MSDDIRHALEDLTGKLPEPRKNLSSAELDELIQRVGPHTARNIMNAKKDFPLARIPFLFSSIDTQAIVDVLANDVRAAIDRALLAHNKKPK